MASSKGFPIIIDYYEHGLKIIGPGTGVARSFVQKNPNTLKVFLMGYLDGIKRSLDDPAYAKRFLAKPAKLPTPNCWRTVIKKASKSGTRT